MGTPNGKCHGDPGNQPRLVGVLSLLAAPVAETLGWSPGGVERWPLARQRQDATGNPQCEPVVSCLKRVHRPEGHREDAYTVLICCIFRPQAAVAGATGCHGVRAVHVRPAPSLTSRLQAEFLAHPD